MTIVSDFHSHVSRSSALLMAQSAKERGLRVLGLSEHIFEMAEIRQPLAHMPLEGPLLPFDAYIQAVQTAARDVQLDVRLGLEVDFIPQKNEQIQAALRDIPWDFLIGSVHEIDGELFEREKRWEREEGTALWHRYYDLLRAAVNSGYFDVVSHPVRMRAKNPYVPENIDDELEQLAAEATQQNVALEINGYDVLTYPGLVRRLSRACAVHRTPISVGSDAHYPREVAQAHPQSEAILREAGISTVRIWQQRAIEEYRI